MPAKNPDLHGNVPDEAPVALVIIDVINDLDFPGGDRLLRHALPMADRLAALKRRAKAAGIPVIYANDNFGRWKSDFRRILERCLQEGDARPAACGAAGAGRGRLLRPQAEALRLLRHHAAYADALPERPADCVASIEVKDNRRALEHMRKTLGADVRPSRSIAVERLAAGVVPVASRTSKSRASGARVRRRRVRAAGGRGR